MKGRQIMKNIIRITAVFLAALTAAGMVSCSKKGGKNDGTSQPVSVTTAAPAPVTSDAGTRNDTEADGLEITPHIVWEQYTEGDDQLILYSANCPVLSGNPEWNLEKINAALEEYCRDYAKIFDIDRVSAKEDYDNLGDRFESYEKSTDYTCYVKDGILSLKYDSYESTGGADDLWVTTALCFDLKTGERIDLAAFLGKDADYAKQYAESAFSLLIKTAPDNYFDNAEAALPELIDGYCFYLNETGLVLFLNSCTIAPDAFGQQTVTVAYANLPT